jgi:hypothetical protein
MAESAEIADRPLAPNQKAEGPESLETPGLLDGGQLEAGSGDVSLLPPIGWSQWKVHRDHGVRERVALAALDVRTAELTALGVDIRQLMSDMADLDAAVTLRSVEGLGVAKRTVDILTGKGVETIGDVLGLDVMTASYSGSGMTALPSQIDLARASLGPAIAYRRRGVVVVEVPRADVEVDVDMENVEEGCYLWGALVSRADGTAEPEYHAFVTWEPVTLETEVANSLRFWRWLRELRVATVEAGRTFRAYCYNAAAENTYLRRLARGAGIEEEVERFIARGLPRVGVTSELACLDGGPGRMSLCPSRTRRSSATMS